MKLIITRGLPACGKSTRAKTWVDEDPLRRIEVNRDALRKMLHNGNYIPQDANSPGTERTTTKMRDAIIREALRLRKDVVCSDTNLPQRTARDLLRLAELAGADFEVWDMTDVPVDVLRDFHDTIAAAGSLPLGLADRAVMASLD